VLVNKAFGRGRTRQTLDVPSAGPARCDARLISNTGVALSYTMRVRVAIESA
jgi:hypothetical protein